jgi:hypothetical protein
MACAVYRGNGDFDSNLLANTFDVMNIAPLRLPLYIADIYERSEQMRMKRLMKTWVLAGTLAVMAAGTATACEFNGIELHGKVQIVESFPDIKVEVVDSFPDINVQVVDSFPDDCGQWEFVESFPDFTIEIVTSFGDLKIQYVTSFPGMAD